MPTTKFSEGLALFNKIANEWRDWERKIAWLPTKVDGRWIWLTVYYERRPLLFPESNCERTLAIKD